ncbi:hypothetical protein FEM21_18560 [Flavobacterium seoulense]|uniref:Uncharacterized protein n=1 Tax=Flavobacterium seoulense TaxID=1492738 RepID=A0A066WX89_9FLAO|nr:hypothetical protein FEM21_18560 [Flavobacterium seoulense]
MSLIKLMLGESLEASVVALPHTPVDVLYKIAVALFDEPVLK